VNFSNFLPSCFCPTVQNPGSGFVAEKVEEVVDFAGGAFRTSFRIKTGRPTREGFALIHGTMSRFTAQIVVHIIVTFIVFRYCTKTSADKELFFVSMDSVFNSITISPRSLRW
jgi:hypothetical protein